MLQPCHLHLNHNISLQLSQLYWCPKPVKSLPLMHITSPPNEQAIKSGLHGEELALFCTNGHRLCCLLCLMQTLRAKAGHGHRYYLFIISGT